ncbi:MAG TPA: hypothetical protein PKC39_00445 [Ferruginibacter sp.]|nr:hypothetical protein [Ferruginibacter sp.]HMP19399.1 hypothetical protein [Ferruginibacter sp.]
MKNTILSFVLLIAITALQAQGQNGNVIRQSACGDATILHQADSIKQEMIKQGFIVVKEASMTMESEYEMPVIVPLNQGSWYQFIFIGDASSKLYEVRMYDWNEKEVMYQKKMWGDVDGNIIRYDYVPRFSEYHMIKPLQVNKKKKKDLCGYVMLLKRLK